MSRNETPPVRAADLPYPAAAVSRTRRSSWPDDGPCALVDALTTDRPYRNALPVDVAYDILTEEARTGWAREGLVRRFIEVHRGMPREDASRAA